ncbi:hypothetical protein AAF712_014136 [Marasmius tenuissimus]|uniref:Duf1665 domain containing protein n=1 Tax=Marasmius tenuissimus TaxID=585030 RepID=A0ABR2ZD69_9AGAR
MSSSAHIPVTELPGFGLPVNTMPQDTYQSFSPKSKDPKHGRLCFPNPITTWAAPNITIREKNMLAVMNEITDKPEWEVKVFDDAIVGKWKEEALSREGVDFSEKIACEELRDKTTRFSKTGRVLVLDSEACVVKSDWAIPTSLADELKTAVKSLEDVPSHVKDWHPGSNGKVLDLVHPSLYPLIYGKTRVLSSGSIPLETCLQTCGDDRGVVPPKPDRQYLTLGLHSDEMFNGVSRGPLGRPNISILHLTGADREPTLDYWSDSYQWLPCEVAFGDDDQNTTEISIPFWRSISLGRYRSGMTVCRISTIRGSFIHETSRLRITVKSLDWEYPLGMNRPRDDDDEDSEDEDFDEDARYEKDQRWLEASRFLIKPEPKDFTPIDPVITQDWAKEGIQVITKLANVELSPEKPEYEGGTWHVEGQLNEHICASAIYYYGQENATESRLAFRQLTQREDLESVSYPQNDHDGFKELFGVVEHGPCVQTLGSVLTREGRIVAFPNVLQHRVQPFRLADPYEEGYRKILALFLVDPYIRTLSTANVPPQQRDRWPADKVADDWPLSLEEAKRVREDLMDQRRAFVDKVNTDYEKEGFSFCEH